MRAALVFLFAFVGAVSAARAQTIETPVPFDSARRVLVVTPPLAERLHLAQPAWPVSGEYRDVRLYSLSQGGFVLVALLPNGALQRYELTDAQRSALAAAIDVALLASGRPTGQVGAEPSEPAGNNYARHITTLGAFVYAPVAASLFDEGEAAGAAYVLTAGGAFFISYDAGQNGHITRAQADLSANLGLAAGVAATGAGYAATGQADKGVRGAALGAAIAGTIAGVGLGKHLTEAEAHGVTVGIEAAGASAWAIAASAQASKRGMATAAVASAPLGYFLGVEYPRFASYTVTAGDLNAMQTAGMVGGLAGATLIGGGHASPRQIGMAVGGSYVVGLLVGDLAIARPFDLTTSEANVVTIGAWAGGIMGLAIPLIASSSNGSLLFGSAAGGAAIGMSAMFGATNAHRAGEPETPTSPRNGSRLELSPGAGVLGLVTRRPGSYPILRFSF